MNMMKENSLIQRSFPHDKTDGQIPHKRGLYGVSTEEILILQSQWGSIITEFSKGGSL
jgi:hypothetical protein